MEGLQSRWDSYYDKFIGYKICIKTGLAMSSWVESATTFYHVDMKDLDKDRFLFREKNVATFCWISDKGRAANEFTNISHNI